MPSAQSTIMAVIRIADLVRCPKIRALNFSTSCYVNNNWRRQQGLEPNPRRFGPLTNLPDYSFLDGRPTPLSYFKKTKILYQEELCKRITELTHEIDAGMEQYYERLEKQKKEKESILQKKLKPKGAALLAKNKGPQS